MKTRFNIIFLTLFFILICSLASVAVSAATGDGGMMKAIKPAALTETQAALLKSRVYSAMLEMEPSVSIADLMIPSEVPQAEMDEYIRGLGIEHPDVFYFNPGWSRYAQSRYGYYIEVDLHYRCTKEEAAARRAALEVKVQEGLSWIPAGATDLQKIKALHDFVCATVTYWEGDTSLAPRTAYQALVEGTDVCEGYALALALLLSRVGIETQWVSNNDHAWIKVRLNGNWYHVDPTWADQTSGIWSAFFLKSDTYFRTGSGGFTHRQWEQTTPACTDTQYDEVTGYGDNSVWVTYRGPASQTQAASFSLSDHSLTLLENGGVATLAINNVTPSGVNVGRATFSSSNAAVAHVSNTGVVTARTPGTTLITCTLDGIQKTCNVTVEEDIGNITKSYYKVSQAREILVYNGSPRKPKVTVTREYGGSTVTLEEGRDYIIHWPADTVNYGRKNLTVEGIGDYWGGVTQRYDIVSNDFSNSEIFKVTIVSSDNLVYDGQPIPRSGHSQIRFRITYNYEYYTMIPSSGDYVVTFENNINAGDQARMIITGKGEFTGSQIIYYTISPADMSSAQVTASDQSFTGSPLTPDPTVMLGSTLLTKDTDYTVAYDNHTNIGTATVTVTGIGNYTGTASGTFVISGAHTHTLNHVAATAASCLTAGNSEYWTCTSCGKFFGDAGGSHEITSGSWVMPATGHNPGSAVTESSIPSTCTEAGSYVEVVSCTVCQTELSRTTVTDPLAAHNLSMTSAQAATCTAAGNSAYYTCSDCNQYFSDSEGQNSIGQNSWIIAATGHSPGSAVTESSIPSTCTEPGCHVEVVSCTVCETELSRTTVTDPLAAHNLSLTSAQAATCTAAGNSAYYTCSNCNQYFSDSEGQNSIGQNSWIIAATGHSPGSAVTESSIPSTCTEPGSYVEIVKCTVCEIEISRNAVTDAATGHTPGQTVIENTVAPTCTEAGSHVEVINCTVCTAEISRNTVTDAALGHSYGDWTVVAAATETAEGLEERVCARDASHKESRAIPKLAPTNVKVTGVKFSTSSTRMLTKDSALLPGQTDPRLTLTPIISPENARNKKVKWATSDKSVATVDAQGRVTGIKTGTVTITATTVDGGKKASIKVQVMKRKEVKLKAGAIYVLKSKLNEKFSLDVMYQDRASNSNVSLYKTNLKRPAERLTVEKKVVNGKTCYLFTRKNSKVGKRAVTELKGKNLVFATNKYTNWQLFRAYQFNDGTIQFINRGSNNAIAVAGGKAVSRANVAPEKADLSDGQRWKAVVAG